MEPDMPEPGLEAPPASGFRLGFFLRTLAGLILAPAACGAVFAAGLSLLDGGSSYGGAGSDLPRSIVMGGVLGGMFGAPIALVLGWSMHLFLVELRLTHMLAYMVSWALLGFGCSLVVLPALSGPLSLTNTFLPTLSYSIAGLGGAAGGLVFWLIRRPDRDHAPGGRSGSNSTSA
jgi:hypothetical protein